MARPDLRFVDSRQRRNPGPRKVTDGEFDATVLAAAGVLRLGLLEAVTDWLPLRTMLPAPGQGALAVQCRSDDAETLAWLRTINDPAVRLAVTAERAFLQALGGGCSAPIAAHCTIDTTDGGSLLTMRALVASPDGTSVIRLSGNDADPIAMARRLAGEARGGAGPHSGIGIAAARRQANRRDAAGRAGRGRDRRSRRSRRTSHSCPGHSLRSHRRFAANCSGHRRDRFVRLDRVHQRERRPVLPPALRLLAASPGGRSRPGDGGGPRRIRHHCGFCTRGICRRDVAQTLGDVAGRRILLPRAETANADIVDGLRARGAIVDDVPIYRTHSAGINELQSAKLAGGIDCILFASGSAVRSIADAAAKHDLSMQSIPAVCIGPVTGDTARSLGFDVVAVAESHTTGGLIDALTGYFRRQESNP